MDNEPVEDRAMRKLRWFMADLESDERRVLASLIAPGVELALSDGPIQEWTPDVVRRWLTHPDPKPEY